MAERTTMRPPPSDRPEESGFSVATYTICFLALVCLTLASYWLSHVSLGAFSTAVALAIAAVKVTLIGLYFMHLLEEPASHRLAAVTATIFIAVLVTFACLDVVTR
jgi:cytochrome c oxidase subunit 4